MFRELTHTLTLKILAFGRPLYEAERIAAVITVWVVLLCAMTGRPAIRDCMPKQVWEETSRPHCTIVQGSIIAGTCGIFPAAAGTAGIPAHSTRLH